MPPFDREAALKRAEKALRQGRTGGTLLYDLAQTLEKVGEGSRAVALLVEIESESGGYRDVAGHIDRLSKVQARG